MISCALAASLAGSEITCAVAAALMAGAGSGSGSGLSMVVVAASAATGAGRALLLVDAGRSAFPISCYSMLSY